ncbi:glycosyltransferase 87 family protein [Corynebacterium gerontici]|uniref:Polyprenol-phosphate-mannose-dependent alpha-(1-2)-phosphatidylinositol mannoside mannosyltransferase n=1 Tax=Corynebacterium gerontici TaxID=2079234 RepID=A0A3G6J1D6_9CORY|nr:glycosyltransferase 87 family protein [Corynebacterium gerontici]AZA11787.1 Polyprenol-phosphate-mannose-dependent alpha-(1-2)-phosphatidylinositol mannoside mannosyltransferase [Corynebacterium gerontici]
MTQPQTLHQLQRSVSNPLIIGLACVVSLAWFLFWNLSPTLYAVPFGTLSVDEWFHYHIDFDVYREGAKAYLAGDNLYTRDYSVWGINLPFTYPPLAAIVFAPFTLVPVNTGGAILNLLSALLLWHVLFMVSKRILPSWSTKAQLGLATVVFPLMLVLEPVRETMSYAQVNIVLMWMVVLDTVPANKRLPRGLFVGLAAAIKLTPAVFGLYFLLKRDWRAAITSVVSGVAASALAFFMAPTSSKTYWLETLHDTGRIGVLAWPSNQSFKGVLYRAGQEASGVWLLFVIIGMLAIAYAMWRMIQQRNDVAAIMLNSAVALLCSPVSWSHHWVWFAPSLLVILVAVVRRKSWALGGGWFLSAFVAVSSPHWGMPRENGLENTWSLLQQFLGNAYVWVAVLWIVIAIFLPAKHEQVVFEQQRP